MRLFIAINFDEKTKEYIKEISDEVKASSIQGRFVKKEHIHLTLEFLGEVSDDRVDLIKEAMDGVSANPFALQLKGLGYFKGRQGNIYWLGVEENKSLLMLQSQLHETLKNQGFELDDRQYKPHITLGRKVKLAPDYNHEKILGHVGDFSFPVDKIELMKSEHINNKLVYSVIYSKRL